MENNKQLNTTFNNQAPVNYFYKVSYRLWLTQEWDCILFDAKDNADAIETAKAKLHSIWLRQGDFTVSSFTISTIDEFGEIIDVASLDNNIDYLYEDDCETEDWENDFDYENYCPYHPELPELDGPTLTQDELSKIELPF